MVVFLGIICLNFYGMLINDIVSFDHPGPDLQMFFHLFQLSFILQSLRNPDVFCFADYPCHSVVIDILKAAPDDENRDIATW